MGKETESQDKFQQISQNYIHNRMSITFLYKKRLLRIRVYSSEMILAQLSRKEKLRNHRRRYNSFLKFRNSNGNLRKRCTATFLWFVQK